MGHELVHFLKRAGVEEQIDPFPRGELPGRMLPFQARLTAAQLGLPLVFLELPVLVHTDIGQPLSETCGSTNRYPADD